MHLSAKLGKGCKDNEIRMTSEKVTLLEVGARDGLQNEKVEFSTADKLALISKLLDAGLRRIEVASFVHPKRVPQMADAEEICAALPDVADAQYIGLVMNKRGYLRALATRDGSGRGIDQVGCVTVVSETFCQNNQGQTVAEAIEIASDIIRMAKRDGMSAQVGLSAVFGCPFEGKVELQRVIDNAKRLAEAEPDEICISDTIGVGVPAQVSEMVGRLKEEIPGMTLRAHLHDTRNTGVANSWAAFQAGCDVIDSSIAGLGGCPFAPGATGNVATEDVVYMFEQSGVDTGTQLDSLIDIAGWLQEKLGRPTPAMVSRAGGFPQGSALQV